MTGKLAKQGDIRQCQTPTDVPITFNEIVTTTYGETIKITGDISMLGGWNPKQRYATRLSTDDN